MDGYSGDVESQMISFFDSLGERDRRRYAAVEAAKLGHGGVAYISNLLKCDPKTIQLGRSENQGTLTPQEAARQRKKTAAARRRKLHRHKLSRISGKS